MNKRKLTIEGGGEQGRYWAELWEYRELFYFLAWRDLVIRYKQTAFGIAWALIRPFVILIILTVVFGKIAGLSSGGVPYPLLVLAALLPWQVFSGALAQGSNSLVHDRSLITKVYFPRLIVPSTAIVVSLVDFLIAAFFMAVLMVWYHYTPDWRVIFLPVFLVIAAAAAFGCALWLSALNVKYRDFNIIVPFLVQFGLYISPVGFSTDVIPAEWRLIYSLNPMVGVIEGFRWCLFGDQTNLNWLGVGISSLLVALVLITGVRHFRRTERVFADYI